MLYEHIGVTLLRASRSRGLPLVATLCVLGSGVSMAAKPVITTFDPPGSYATYALSINAGGAIVGYYRGNGAHGFLRASDGTITTIDGPGDTGGTYAYSINGRGSITGHFADSIGPHGFVQTSDGTFTSFDAPDSSQTYPQSINNRGTITGYYIDNSGNSHGFVRATNGTITAFDAS